VSPRSHISDIGYDQKIIIGGRYVCFLLTVFVHSKNRIWKTRNKKLRVFYLKGDYYNGGWVMIPSNRWIELFYRFLRKWEFNSINNNIVDTVIVIIVPVSNIRWRYDNVIIAAHKYTHLNVMTQTQGARCVFV